MQELLMTLQTPLWKEDFADVVVDDDDDDDFDVGYFSIYLSGALVARNQQFFDQTKLPPLIIRNFLSYGDDKILGAVSIPGMKRQRKPSSFV
jgi:hypothetical protein